MKNTNKKKHNEKLGFYIAAFAVVCIILILYILFTWDQGKSTAHQKTQEVEAFLTRKHGEEARAVTLHFEQTWFGLEMHKDPKPYLHELLTGPLLNYYLTQVNSQNSDYWLVPSQTDVTDLKIVDYSEKSMKVITCLDQGTNKVTRDGTTTERYPIHQYVKLFLLIKDNGSWKVGNLIDMTDPKKALRDWDFMSEDLKNMTGDIDPLVYDSCKISK